MNFFAAAGLATCISSVLFGVFSLIKGKKPLHKIWVVFNLVVALWGFSAFKFSTTLDQQRAFFWLYVGHVGVALIPILYIRFVIELLGISRPKALRLIYAVGAVFFTLNLLDFAGITKLFITHLRFVFNEFFVDSPPGPTYPFFVAFFFYLVGYAHWLAVREVRVAQGLRRVQIKYFLWAMAPAFYGGGTAFIMVFGINFYPWPHATVPFYPIVMTYAIIRHQLLDIEVVIKRTVVFAGLVASVVAVVSLVAFVSQDVLAHLVQIPKWLSNVLAAAIIAAVYGKLRDWLVNATDKYLFQKKYDFREVLKKFMDEVMQELNLDQLVKRTVDTLSDTVKLDSCSLLLINKDTRQYVLVASKGTNPAIGPRPSAVGRMVEQEHSGGRDVAPIGAGVQVTRAVPVGLHGQPLVLEEDEPFITFLRQTHEPIGRDGELGKVKFPEAVTDRLKQLNARLCLPMDVHDELIGVLCLGKKKSDEEFAKDDMDVLVPVAKTLAIAVSNAQLVEELQKTQAEAAQREKLAVIGTLSAGINHEICNPLGIVKAQCEAFLIDQQDGILVGKSAQEMLERTSSIMQVALKQIDRATAITQKLSNFAKPIKEPTAQPVSVAKEVDEVLALVGHDLNIQKIEITKEIDPNLPDITVDRRQFQEVLFNLIRNAGQAIKPPGTIWVRAYFIGGSPSTRPAGGGTRSGFRPADEGTGPTDPSVGLHKVRIEIQDTGSGMSPETLAKIYNPFFTTKEPGKGTGLGLFIVRQIVERNRGRISVESTPGKGTTFSLEFPVGKAEAAAVAV